MILNLSRAVRNRLRALRRRGTGTEDAPPARLLLPEPHATHRSPAQPLPALPPEFRREPEPEPEPQQLLGDDELAMRDRLVARDVHPGGRPR